LFIIKITDNQCDNRIKDISSKKWRVCNGVLRSDTKNQKGGYSYISKDPLKENTALATNKLEEGQNAAYLDYEMYEGFVMIRLKEKNNKNYYLMVNSDMNVTCDVKFVSEFKEKLESDQDFYESNFYFWVQVFEDAKIVA